MPDTRPIVLNYAKGGLGNQLFQHVFALSLARRLGAEMRTDISYFGHDPYGFKAGVWSLEPDAKTATVAELAGPGCYVLKEGQIQQLAQLQSLPPDARALVLEGYWQGEAYFEADIARQTYARLAAQAQGLVDPALVQRLRASPNAIAVHLRRRDYAHMGLCKDSYYLAALQHLRANAPDAELFVFSDEPNYARHLLGSAGLAFQAVASGSDLGDLYLMSLCRHFVISNSSYSWWAAWFGEAQGGQVCCPKEWVTIDATPSPCPPRWLQIEGAVRPFQIDAAEVAAMAARLQRQRFDAAIRAWFGGRGDQTLRLQFEGLSPTSTVLDLGGYKGDWTAEIVQRYGATVHVFEPIAAFHDQICNRFSGQPRVHPHHLGLGARDETLQLHLSADGTGAFASGGTVETVQVREAAAFLEEQGIGRIDLLKINIEGAEYELLEHLLERGLMDRVERLQVQFHDFVPGAIERRAALVQRLARSHRQTWCFYFVWEEWRRLPTAEVR